MSALSATAGHHTLSSRRGGGYRHIAAPLEKIDPEPSAALGFPCGGPDEWLPAAEGRIEDGAYVVQLALPGVDPKKVDVSLMDNVLTVKGERQADHDTAGKDHFVREVAYGAFQRSFALPEGVDAAQVEAKYANGMLQVRVPTPQAAIPRTIEVKAA